MTATAVPLFGDLAAAKPPAKEPWRAVQLRRIAQGVHPLHGLPLAGNDETCKTCAHRVVLRMGSTYHKCAAIDMTHGAKTDVRLSWPACKAWAEATDPMPRTVSMKS